MPSPTDPREERAERIVADLRKRAGLYRNYTTRTLMKEAAVFIEEFYGEPVPSPSEGEPTEAHTTLFSIGELEDGWDGYGSPAPTEAQIELAGKVVDATNARHVCPYGGGIAVEVSDDLTIYVEEVEGHGGPEAVARLSEPEPSDALADDEATE